MLRVHFTTGTDLAAFTRSRGRYIGATAVPCRALKDKDGYLKAYYIELQGVYDRYGEIAGDDKAQQARKANGGSGGDYAFYIAVVAPPPSTQWSHHMPYDLRAAPEDMCAHIHGGTPSDLLWIKQAPAFMFSTNDILVPAEAIRAALEKRPD